MLPNDSVLDNPVWFALSEKQRTLAIRYEGIQFYDPSYCPFGGFQSVEQLPEACAAYSKRCKHFFIVGEKPLLPGFLKIDKELVCLQMIIHQKHQSPFSEKIEMLTTEHREALYELVNLVQPGYFKSKTFLLGNYYGIFKNGMLIAAAGERMKTDHFTEVSAIVTHPEHTGKGYASQLTAHVVDTIFEGNKIPFLHVVETNHRAIALYEKLGFEIRRKISFWSITTAS